MDPSEDFIQQDEIIADSEDDMDELGSSSNPGKGSAMSMPPPRQKPELSSIAAFTPTKGVQDSSISAFAAGLTGSGTAIDQHSFAKDAESSGYSNVFDTSTGVLSIADRAKTRKRKSADFLELTSDEDELSLKPTTSSKSKTKAKAKSSATLPKPQDNQPSSSTGDQQRTSDSSGSKPRPKPRPIAKKPRTENAAYLEAIKDSNPHSLPLGGPELPIATSPTRGTSRPPSELPPSSLSSGIPRIETMGNHDDLFDGPLSSPGSLFGDDDDTSTRKKQKKRKVYPTDVEIEIDELAPSDIFGSVPPDGPPPPTFFAGSSQPDELAILELPRAGNSASTSSNAAPTLDVIDLTDLPLTLAPAKTAKKPVKPKKPRKQITEEDYGEWEVNGAAGVYVFDDDNDDDFDPSRDGVGKKKGKSKAKGKGKEKEKPAKTPKAKGKGKGQTLDTPSENALQQNPETPSVIPEVVITTKPARKSRKKKETNAGGSDAPGTSNGSKEVFKSREFIDDSGDEAPAGPAPQTTNIGDQDQGRSEPEVLDPPDEAPIVDVVESTTTGSKRQSSGKKRKSNVLHSEDEDEAEPLPKPATKKKGKKKAVVDAGESAEEWDKQVDVIDEDKEVPRLPEPKEKTVVQNDDDMLEDDEPMEEALPEIKSSSKENRAPKAASHLVTPNNRPNTSLSSGSKPGAGSLYARYEIAPRTRGPTMSELIRRANSHPSSPFANATPSDSKNPGGKIKSRTSLTPASQVYSPYLKSSRSLLNKIAPLHPNRRTPPPPPPPLPPKKKTKKELEREEKWEEEMVESVGGREAWAALGDDERKEMRRAKFAMEMGGWDD